MRCHFILQKVCILIKPDIEFDTIPKPPEGYKALLEHACELKKNGKGGLFWKRYLTRIADERGLFVYLHNNTDTHISWDPRGNRYTWQESTTQC